MTKDQLAQAIRQSALSEGESMELVQVLFETMLGGALLGMGMDLSTGTQAIGGRWVPAPMCRLDHANNPKFSAGWRNDASGADESHEHWVES